MSALSSFRLGNLNQGINNAKHKALDELEAMNYDLSSSSDQDPNKVLLESLKWVLGLGKIDLDWFLERNKIKKEAEWGREPIDDELRLMLLKMAVARVRSVLVPCDVQYQYPGRQIVDKWVLPVGMTAKTSLEDVLFGRRDVVRFGSKELSWTVFVEVGLLTVGDLIMHSERLRAKRGIGAGTITAVVQSLASHGFIDYTVKQIVRK